MNGTPLREYASLVNENLNTSSPVLSIRLGSSNDRGEAGITSGAGSAFWCLFLALRLFRASLRAFSTLADDGFPSEETFEPPDEATALLSGALARRSESSVVMVS